MSFSLATVTLATVAMALTYLLFLSWHRGWRGRPLTLPEVEVALQRHLAHEPNSGLSVEERQQLRAFFEADDGQPFWMLNLMKLRPLAIYSSGKHPQVKSARHAHGLYSRMVLKQLLRRGSYPVFVARKIANVAHGGTHADFFEELAIVRYRSRRDMLEMIADPVYIDGVVHKWASLDTSVIVPTRRLLQLDLGLLVPFVLLTIWLAAVLLARGAVA